MKKLIVVSLLAGVSLTACSNTVVKSQKAVKENTAKAEELLKMPRSRMDQSAGKPITFHDNFYLGDKGYENENGMPLPAKFSRDVLISSSTPLTMQEAIGKLADVTSLRFSIEDLEPKAAVKSQDSKSPSAIVPNGSFGASNNDDEGVLKEPAIVLREYGSLENIINKVSAHFGYDWVHVDGKVRFFRFLTKTYHVNLLPGEFQLNTAASSSSSPAGGGGGGASGGSGGGGQFQASIRNDTVYTGTVDMWKDFRESVEAIVGDKGKYSVNSSTGRLTLTASREIQKRVKTFIDDYQADMNKQVSVDVTVYTVTMNDSDRSGFSLDTLFSPRSGNFNMSASGVIPGVSGLGQGGSASFAILNEMSRFNGTSILVDALSTRGKVATVESTTAVAPNHTPTPVQVVRTTAYLAKVTETISGDGLSATSLEPNNVTTGFTLNMLPNIMKDGRILLQYNLNISELTGLQEFGTGDGQNVIQLPQVSSSSFSQRSYVNSGDTIVMAGFESLANTFNSNSTLPNLPLFGGSVNGKEERRIVVIAIRPVIQNVKPRSVNVSFGGL